MRKVLGSHISGRCVSAHIFSAAVDLNSLAMRVDSWRACSDIYIHSSEERMIPSAQGSCLPALPSCLTTATGRCASAIGRREVKEQSWNGYRIIWQHESQLLSYGTIESGSCPMLCRRTPFIVYGYTDSFRARSLLQANLASMGNLPGAVNETSSFVMPSGLPSVTEPSVDKFAAST